MSAVRWKSRGYDSQAGEPAAIEAVVAGQEPVRLAQGMGADEEVRHEPVTLRALGSSAARALAGPPQLAGQGGRPWLHDIEADPDEIHGFRERLMGREAGAHLRPHDVASNEGSGAVGGAQGLT